MGKSVGSGYPPAKEVIRGSPARARNSRIAEGCTRSARRANVVMSNLLRSAVDGVERRPDDGVGVQPMVSVHAVEVAGLSECRDPEVDGRGAGGPREERERVGAPVEDSDERGTACRPPSSTMRTACGRTRQA